MAALPATSRIRVICAGPSHVQCGRVRIPPDGGPRRSAHARDVVHGMTTLDLTSLTSGARPSVSLVGRDRSLAALRQALATACAGQVGCVIVEGPAGIGKTRMLGEAAREAGSLRMAVAAAQAIELDRIAPLTTLLVALRGCRPPVLDSGRMASLDTMATQHGNGFWVVHQLNVAIERYAADRPLLIALDDVQWADEVTALALRILVPAISSSPALWLLASRPPSSRSPVRGVLDTQILGCAPG